VPTADVLLDTYVSLHVVLEVVLRTKLFPTPVALERFLIAVNKHVSSEVQCAGELSRTKLASMHFLILRSVSPGKFKFSSNSPISPHLYQLTHDS
jgi:hypothetical protein